MRLVGLAIALIFLTPLTAEAQQAGKVYRIGIIGFRATADLAGPSPQSPAIKALIRGLNELGYVYGTDFVTEPRGSEGRPERFPGLAAELVRLRVDVILAPGPALPALKQATSSIPVIMTATIDPVGMGFVQSLGRPGGNFTGFSLQSAVRARALYSYPPPEFFFQMLGELPSWRPRIGSRPSMSLENTPKPAG